MTAAPALAFRWGARSLARRAELHEDLQRVFDLVLEMSPFDCAITDGHRGESLQREYFRTGASELDWPRSKHNKQPALAGHLDPYPINYRNPKLYYVLAGVVFSAAKECGIAVRWGGDWDRDYDLTDQTFNDLAHWELM